MQSILKDKSNSFESWLGLPVVIVQLVLRAGKKSHFVESSRYLVTATVVIIQLVVGVEKQSVCRKLQILSTLHETLTTPI